MNLAKPTKAERKAESLRREAEKEAVYARNQIGGGQDPKLWENGSARYASYKLTQETQLQIESGRVKALENRLKAADETKATKELDPFQLWQQEQERGEKAFERLMILTKGGGKRNPVNPPATPHQVQPLVESKPAVPRTPYVAPVVKHEALRVSILTLLSAMGKRPTGSPVSGCFAVGPRWGHPLCFKGDPQILGRKMAIGGEEDRTLSFSPPRSRRVKT